MFDMPFVGYMVSELLLHDIKVMQNENWHTAEDVDKLISKYGISYNNLSDYIKGEIDKIDLKEGD